MGESRPAWLALGVAFCLLAAALLDGRIAPERTRVTPPQRGAARLLWGLPLDLNAERAASLEALPGIGPTRAGAIVEGRPFCRVSELSRVRGIGPRTVERLRGLVAVAEFPLGCPMEGIDPGWHE